MYFGEVGVYYKDIAGGTGPCPSDPNDACFNTDAADGAISRWTDGSGIGITFYYLGGGADSQYEPAYGSPYCFGFHQGYLAVRDANSYFTSYIAYAFSMALDIEQNNSFGWSNTTQAGNRDVFNGFRDYVQGFSSDDPSNCNYSNSSNKYQFTVYSAPSQWSYSFGSRGTITLTPVWTYSDCCQATWPGDF
jgi:hypothetical protein